MVAASSTFATSRIFERHLLQTKLSNPKVRLSKAAHGWRYWGGTGSEGAVLSVSTGRSSFVGEGGGLGNRETDGPVAVRHLRQG